MNIFNSQLIEEVAVLADVPTGDSLLDGFFESYHDGDPKDRPVYYRFLYHLAGWFRDRPLTMIELGCNLGYASLHFLRGGGRWG